MPTEVGTDGATTLSRMNSSGYVGHVTIFRPMLTTACSLVVALGLGFDLVSSWLVVTHVYYFPSSLSHCQLHNDINYDASLSK